MSSDLTFGITIGASMSGSFASATNKARKMIGDIDTSMKTLRNQKLNIKEFKRLSSQGKLGAAALEKLSVKLKKSGIDVKNLERDTKQLNRSLFILGKTKKLNLNIEHTKNQLKEAKAEALAIAGTAYGIGKLYGSAANTIKAQGELKTLKISDAGIKSITKSAHNMAMQFGQITAPQFISASYDIKSGISSLSEDGVNHFTKLAATTAIATKSSVGEMTKLYALGHNIFSTDFDSDADFGEKFSGAIAATVETFRTDGSDLAQGFSSIGASAKSMGVSLTEQLTILGVSKGSFNSASEAATSYRSFLANVGKAQDKLGVVMTDSSGKMLPMVDILDAISLKFDNLEDVTQSDAIKEAFGSDEAVKLIKGLIDKKDELRSSEEKLQKAMKNGSQYASEMAKMAQQGHGLERLGNAFSYLGYTIGKTLEPVFNGLANTVAAVGRGLAWVDEKVSWLIPTVTSLTLGVGVTIMTLKAWRIATLGVRLVKLLLLKELNIFRLAMVTNTFAMKLYTFGSTLLTGSLKLLGGALRFAGKGALWLGRALVTSTLKIYALGSTLLTGSLKLLGGALRFAGKGALWLGRALLMNPIGLAITAIALAAFAIYKYWQPIKSFFSGLWTQIKTAFDGGLSGIGALILDFSPLGLFYKVFAEVMDWFGVELPSSFSEFGKNMIGGLLNGLLSGLPKLGGVIDTVKGWFGFGEEDKASSTITSNKPLVQYSQPPQNAIKNASGNKKQTVTQNMDVQVVVHNPSSTVDVEQAISNAMRVQGRGTSLADEDI